MRFLHPQLLLGMTFLLLCATAFAQQGSSLCTNTALVPVFKQTFGQGSSATSTTTAPTGSTNYIFGTVSTDGQYIVTPLVENANKGDWTKGRDHTGDANGNMFLVNAGGGNSIFLQQDVSGLCSGSSYSFSAWLANVNTPNTQTVCGTSLVYPKITFNIRDASNNILGTYTTGNLPLSPNDGPLNWQKYGFQFDLPDNTTSLRIEIVDSYGGGAACGNDVALDDILFEACIPQITISLNSSSDSVCAGGNVSLLSTLINSPYTNPAYQWQKKNTLTTNWDDVSAATTGAGSYSFNNATLGDAGLYRVLVAPNVASISNATCSAISNGVAFTVNPLPYLSPTYNNPVCSGNNLLLKANPSNGSGIYNSFKWTGPQSFESISADTTLIAVTTNAGGMYSISTTDSKGCSANADIFVQIDSTPVLNYVLVTDSICSGSNAKVSVISSLPNSSFYWGASLLSGSVTGSGPVVNPEFTGTKESILINTGIIPARIQYSVYAQSTAGCISTTLDSIITILPLPTNAVASADKAICNKTQINLVGNTPAVGIGYWKQLSGPSTVLFADSLQAATTASNLVTGSYTFSWNIFNDCITNSDTIQINNVPVPVPSFTLSDTVVCGPTSILFTNTSNQDSLFQYNWNFGNGQQSTLKDPGSINFQPSVSGDDTTYTITLTIRSLCDTVTLSKQITVQRKPIAAFTVVKQNNCLPLLVNFINNSAGTASQYKYIFGDGKDTSSTNFTSLSHTYFANNDTSFTALLIATNQCGADTATQNIQTIRNPLIINTNFADTAVCGFPFTLNINNSSSGALEYNWNWGDGNNNNSTSSTNIQHIYQQAGTYTITHTLKTVCGDTSINKTIHIYPSVNALINAIPADKCLGDTIQLQSTSDNSLLFQWKANDSLIGTTQQLLIPTTQLGAVNYKLLVSKVNPFATCIDSTTVSSTVNPIPFIQFTTVTDTVCSGNNATITLANSVSNSAYYWSTVSTTPTFAGWVVGTNPESTGSKTFTLSNTGVNNEKLTHNIYAISTKGCKSNNLDTSIIILPIPDKAIAGINQLLCNKTQINLVGNTPAVGIGYWKQLSGPSTVVFADSLQAATTASNLATGSYTFSWNIFNDCITNSDTIQINNVPVPVPSFTLSDTVVCGPTSILFTNTSNQDSLFQYNWNFGNGQQSTLKDPGSINFQPSVSGNDTTYTITLTIRSICDTVTLSKQITVQRKPIAAFTAVKQNNCLPLLVNFINNSAGTASQYKYIFGDGKDTSSTNFTSLSHTYFANNDTSFTALLIATNQCGADTATQNIQTIRNPLIINTNFADTAVCGFPFTLNINNSSSGALEYNWNWGDGNNNNSTSSTNIQHIYQQAGTYTITHTLKTVCGDTSINKTIHIYPSVNALINAIPADKCLGDTIQLQSTSDNSLLFQWKANDSLIGTTQQLLIPTTQLGAVNYKLLVSKVNPFATCIDSTTVSSTVNPIPFIQFTTVTDTVCSGNNAKVVVNSSLSNSAFYWKANLISGTVTGSGPTVNPEYTGIKESILINTGIIPARIQYKVYAQSLKGCKSNTLDSIVTIQPLPSTAVAGANIDLCNVTQANLNGNTPTVGIGYWKLISGPNTVTFADSLQASTTVSNLIPGSYAFSWNISNDCVTYSDTIYIKNIPAAIPAFALSDTAVCGFPFTLSVKDSSSGALEYKWNWGDGNTNSFTNSTNVQHTYQQAGTYTITQTLKTSCADTTIRKLLHIYPTVKALINAIPADKCLGDTIRFSSGSDSTLSYEWSVNGNTIGSQQILPFSFSVVGNYQAMLTVRKIHPQLTCIDSTKQLFTIIGERKGSLTVAPTTGYCTPFTVQLVNNSQPAATVTWSTGGGNTTTGDTASYTFTNSGDYWVQLKAVTAGGCVYKDSTLVQVKSPRGSFEFKGGAYCNGNNQVSFTTNTTYTDLVEWNFGDGTIQRVAPGPISHTYLKEGIYHPTLTLISNTGCRIILPAKDSIIIESIKAKFTVSTVYECGQTNFNFADSSIATFGVASYEWLLNNKTFSINSKATAIFKQTGTHETTLIAKSNYGCTDSIRGAYNVSIFSYPKVNINSINEACLNNLMELKSEVSSVDSVIYRLWNLGNGQKASDSSVRILYFDEGKYTVQLTVATINKCLDSALKQITIHPVPIIKVESDQKICSGDSITLKAVGATNYVWKDQQENIICNNCLTLKVRPQKTTSYKVIGYNEFGCTQVAATNVQVIERPKIKALASDTICVGENVRLWVSGASTYQWLPDAGLNNYTSAAPIAAPLTTTTYKVIGKDQQNCYTDTAYTRVVVGNPTPVTVGRDTNFIAGSKIQLRALTPQNNIQKYVWSGGADLSCVNCPDPVARVVYDECISCKVTNIYGCTSTDTVCIKTFCPTTEVFIPNAFTPDGDGVNDILFIQAKGVRTIKSLRIFNRWGEPVFERTNFLPNDASAGWNGKIKGNYANPDVYVYICEVICERGASQFYKGNIAILK